jgi:ribosomal-protein-alanine N-acetyltransferase
MLISETKRLIIRELTLDDLDVVAALFADPIGMAPKGGPRPYEDVVHIVNEAIFEYKNQGFGWWAVVHRDDDKIIGLCGLLDQSDNGHDVVELAYMFDKDYWRQGFATESAIAVRDYAFEPVGLKRLVSCIGPENTPSKKVAQNVGMQYETGNDFVDHRGRASQIYSMEKT